MSQVFEIAFTVTGPLLTRSQDAMALGLDAHGLTREGVVVVPGSHLRGHLRQALAGCLDLLGDAHGPLRDEVDALCRLLGSKSRNGDEPERAALRFPDVFIGAGKGSARTLNRIRIDEQSGRVDPGALLLMQSPLAPGETMRFSGRLKLDAASPGITPERIRHWLHRALSLVPAVGSEKAIGFGRISEVEIKVSHKPETSDHISLPDGQRIGLRLTLDRPFCFADPIGRSDNRFVSLPYIPGAALLGALFAYARAHRQDDAHCQHILAQAENIRFSHAHPVPAAQPSAMPIGPIPRSWVIAKNVLYDLADGGADAPINGEAPAFSVDWKSAQSGKVETYLARQASVSGACATPGRTLRVRTKIEHSRNSAEDGKLFATECIDPHGFEYHTDLHLDAAGEPKAALRAALAEVLPRALHGLGKTKAEVSRVRPVAATALPDRSDLKTGQHLVLTLRSDAAIPLDTGQLPATGAAEQLKTAYQAAFDGLFGEGVVRLIDYFASQRLAGGNYLYQRFRKPAGLPYQPIVLTEAGSVFVFRIEKTEGLVETLHRWCQTGLPVGEAVAVEGMPSWQLNPYRPQNGHGEVRLRVIAGERTAARRLIDLHDLDTTTPDPAQPNTGTPVTATEAQP